MVRGEVLYQHESHSGLAVGGHPGKNASKAARPPAEAPIPTTGNPESRVPEPSCSFVILVASPLPGSGAGEDFFRMLRASYRSFTGGGSLSCNQRSAQAV